MDNHKIKKIKYNFTIINLHFIFLSFLFFKIVGYVLFYFIYLVACLCLLSFVFLPIQWVGVHLY